MAGRGTPIPKGSVSHRRSGIRRAFSPIAHKRRNVRFKRLRRVHTPPQPLTAHTAAHTPKHGGNEEPPCAAHLKAQKLREIFPDSMGQKIAEEMTAAKLRLPAKGGLTQFIGCYSAPTVFTASNLKEFSQILCFRMCCTDQFPTPFALCAAVCAFRGWGGVFTHQSPLKRALRRLWAVCERSLRILFRQRRNESYRGEFFLLTMPCFGDCSPLFTRSIKAQDKGPQSQAPAARPQSPAVRGFPRF